VGLTSQSTRTWQSSHLFCSKKAANFTKPVFEVLGISKREFQMKLRLSGFLIAVFLCFPVHSVENTGSSWGNYTKYSLPSSYLYSMGFIHTANCAISLMNSIPSPSGSTLEDFERVEAITYERDKVFEAAINEGINTLKKSKLFSKLSEQELRKYVYQNLMLSEQLLKTSIAFLKSSSKKGEEVEGSNLSDATYFKNIYLKTNCVDKFKFDISKPKG
jgi:hypothetical protein